MQYDRIISQLVEIQQDIKNLKAKKFGFFRRRNLLIIISIVLIILFFSLQGKDNLALPYHPHIAAIEIEGVITQDMLQKDRSLINLLDQAFSHPDSRAIMLSLHSGGGDAYTGFVIAQSIIRLKKRYPEKKVYALVKGLCASGCYLISAAADQIISHQASLVGSIGVLLGAGVRLDRFLDDYKIDYDPIKSGAHKDALSPLAPKNRYAQKHLQKQADYLHQSFIHFVKTNRPQLKSSRYDVFSGLIWTGGIALDIGLVDQLGDQNTLLETLNQVDANETLTFHYYEYEKDFFDEIRSFTSSLTKIKEDIGLIRSTFTQSQQLFN